MRIAVVQTTGVEDTDPPAERLARIAERVREGMPRGDVDLVALPELWSVGAFRPKEWTERAEPLDGPTVTAMAEVARELRTVLHLGSIVERDGDALYNTSVVLGPDGAILATYRKLHLFRAGGAEADILTPGEEIVVADLPLHDGSTLRTGFATCYELRFPELFRAMTDRGAQAVVVPAAWPKVRGHVWPVLVQARAIESQCLVVGAAATGVDGRTPLTGRSLVVDADGHVLTSTGTEPGILLCDVDPASVAETRAAFPVLEDRLFAVDDRPGTHQASR